MATLHIGAKSGHTRLVKLLLARRVDVDAADIVSNTTRRGWGVAHDLVGRGADANAENKVGAPPLQSHMWCAVTSKQCIC